MATTGHGSICDDKCKDSKGGSWYPAQLRARRSFLFVGLLSVCLMVTLASYRPEWLAIFSPVVEHADIGRFLPGNKRVSSPVSSLSVQQDQRGTEEETTAQKTYTYTPVQVEQAMRDVLGRQRQNPWLSQQEIDSIIQAEPNYRKDSAETPEREQPGKVLYEIELYSGGVILSDNATISDDTIAYSSSSGLEIVIDASEVKALRRLKVRR